MPDWDRGDLKSNGLGLSGGGLIGLDFGLAAEIAGYRPVNSPGATRRLLVLTFVPRY